MKKAILYTFAAVVLGVGIMLFPLWTFFRSYGQEGPLISSPPYIKPMYALPNYSEYTEERMKIYPTVWSSSFDNKQQTILDDSFLKMAMIGFIAAIVAYVIVRRKVHRETYLPTYRFPPVDR